MSPRIICLLGILFYIALAWAISSNRRRFPWRVVAGGLGLQFLLAILILKTSGGRWLLGNAGDAFQATLKCVEAGSGFVFNQSGQDASLLTTFAFGVLPTIIFFSSLMSILYYIGIMQRVVAVLAWVMRYTLGTSGPETLAAAANVFVGQTKRRWSFDRI